LPGAFPGEGKTAAPGGYTWGDYCETDYVAELNSVLVDIGICDNMEAKINFLSEVRVMQSCVSGTMRDVLLHCATH
jgi:hypothetical protein